MYQKIFKIIFLFSLVFLSTHTVFASRVFIDDTLKTFPSDKEFFMDVFLDTEGSVINAVKGEIVFPDELLDFSRVSSNNSIVSTWIEPVQQNGNTVYFSGIIFNGFDTVVDPVTLEEKKGTLLRVYFKAKKEGSGVIKIIDPVVYKNDGQGTPIRLKDETTLFVVSSSVNGQFPSEVLDITPPEPFTPRITKSQDVFEGKFFLVFNTTDKESGIDHYEVKEGDRDWIITPSPYGIMSGNLLQTIQVKAVDRAGNIRIENVQNVPSTFYVLIFIILLCILVFYFIRVYLRRHKKDTLGE